MEQAEREFESEAETIGRQRRLSANSTQLLLVSIIPYQLNQLSYQMNRLLDRDLRAHGLSISAWRIMAVLDFNQAVSIGELAHFAMIEQSTLSRALARMEAAGLLQSEVSMKDGRVRSISLTRDGRERYETVRALTLKHVSRIVHGFSREERKILSAFISRMRENIASLPLEDMGEEADPAPGQ